MEHPCGAGSWPLYSKIERGGAAGASHPSQLANLRSFSSYLMDNLGGGVICPFYSKIERCGSAGASHPSQLANLRCLSSYLMGILAGRAVAPSTRKLSVADQRGQATLPNLQIFVASVVT